VVLVALCMLGAWLAGGDVVPTVMFVGALMFLAGFFVREVVE
jgi:hypothetical protein